MKAAKERSEAGTADRPAVDVLFTNYNHGNYLDGLIGSYRRSTYPIGRIIMVDNGSTDGSVEAVRARHPEVHIIENGRNLGFAQASNIGLRASAAPYVCLTGPDVEVDPGWLAGLVEAMRAAPGCIFACSRVMDLRERDMVLSAGCSINYLGYMVLRDRFRRIGAADGDPALAIATGTGSETGARKTRKASAGADSDGYGVPVPVVDSTSVLIDRGKFLELGLLDEDLFLYYDEMDFCLRAGIGKGWKCLYVPGSVVYHGYGSEASSFRGEKARFPAFRAYLMTKNRILVLLKCYQVRTLLSILPMLALFEALTVAFHIRHGVFSAYLEGLAWNLRHLPSTLDKRRALQRSRVRPDRALLSAEPLSVNPRLHASRIEAAAYRIINRMISEYWKFIGNPVGGPRMPSVESRLGPSLSGASG